MKVKLEVIKGPERGKTFVLTEPSTCVVGRSEEAHFKFSEEDPYISKKHFLLEFKPPKVYFRNLDTTNPSKINDLYAEEAELVNGDIVEVGYTKLCVSVEHDVREGSETGNQSADLNIMSKSEIVKRLHELAKRKPPKVEPFEGVLIDYPQTPYRFEYVCPKCEEKTLYATKNGDRIGSGREGWEIQACRRRINEIKGVYIELDEAEFCKRCSPEVESPKLNIVARFKRDGNPHRVRGICEEDLQLLAEFLEGSDKHILQLEEANFLNVREQPLKNYIDRLKVLLNVHVDI